MSMIRRITLQNYMSHADTVIEPATGLTVLVGPNNCGKSAVVSALDTLCNNATGGYMVRHDEKEARVTVETDDGHTFVWRRRGNAVSYVIDGREIHRVARSVPEDLHTFLRLPKVDAGENGDPFDVHFGAQKSPIFLLNEPESRAALFFASSSDAAILLEMQKRHRNKVKERKNDEKRLTREIEILDAELDALAPLDALVASMAEADDQYQELKRLEAHIQTLAREMEALRAHSDKHGRVLQQYQCLAPLKPPPHLNDTAVLESLKANIIAAKCRLQGEEERACALKNLNPPPVPQDAETLESVAQALSKEEQKCRQLQAQAACLALLYHPPETNDTGPLERIVADLESAGLAGESLYRRQCVLQKLTQPPQLAAGEMLAESIRELATSVTDVARYEASIKGTEAEIAKVEAQMRFAASMGASALLSSPADKRRQPFSVKAVIGFAAIVAVILLAVFGRAWFGGLQTGPLVGKSNRAETKAATVAKADDGGKTGKPIEPPRTGEEETPKVLPTQKEPEKEEPKTTESKKEGPKKKEAENKVQPTQKEPEKEEAKTTESKKKETENAEPKKDKPKKERPTPAKQLRLKEVRKLLNDAGMANEKGQYLEAVLGFGQAAILYPEELTEVEDPAKVRRQFIHALNRYQAAVERALQKAAEHKAGDR
jgi:exonuclease SbcC